MRHISLDESFWRSATEALVSGDCIEDVEPSLLDVGRLLRGLQSRQGSLAPGRVGLLTLLGTEEERALGLTLAALLARGGVRVLLADCDFGDEIWSRLLGAAETRGIADHVTDGVAPLELVRPTSWPTLSYLTSGLTKVDPAAVLRSDPLRACLDAAGQGHDVVCVGAPLGDGLEWGRGMTAGMDRAVLLGPSRDELAFELAIPRLLRRVELAGTLDVPALGRRRPELAAALPAAVLGFDEAPLAAGDDPVMAARSFAPSVRVGSYRGPGSETLFSAPDDGLADSREASLLPVSASALERRSSPMTLPASEVLALFEDAGPGPDPESAADVAFLARLERGDRETPGQPGAPRERGAVEPIAHPRAPSSSSPSLVHPRLKAVAIQRQLDLTAGFSPPEGDAPSAMGFRELAQEWPHADAEDTDDADPPEAGDASSGGGWLILGAVLLCLALGGGAFWYWRASQQIPEGRFTFIESGDAGGASGRLAADGGGEVRLTPATGGGTASSKPSPEAVASASGASRPEGATPAGAPTEVRAAQPGQARGAVVAPAADEVATETSAVTDRREAQAREGDRATSGPSSARGVEAASPEAESPPDPTGLPKGAYEPPKTGPVLAYSLHVGSYQAFESAQRAALDLRGRGLDAFVTPILLEGKGRWYRVFVDAVPDAPASQAALERARRSGGVGEATVRETPWTLYLGTFETPGDAGALVARLARSGISGYAVGHGPVNVYAGAFEAAGDADLLNRQLRDRGFESALVRRRGAESR